MKHDKKTILTFVTSYEVVFSNKKSLKQAAAAIARQHVISEASGDSKGNFSQIEFRKGKLKSMTKPVKVKE